VNPAKYMEIVFVDKHRKWNAQPPPPLPGIERVASVKILGVTITNSLSEHVHTTISSCAQTLYALRVLRSHERLFSALSSSPSYSMHQKRGGVSLRQQNDIVLMHSFVVVHVVVSFHLTRRRSKLSTAQPTKNCLRT